MRKSTLSRLLIVLMGLSLLTLGACREKEPDIPVPGSIISPDIIIENGVLKKWPNYDVPVSGIITIPESVVAIDNGVFANYKDLKKVNFPPR